MSVTEKISSTEALLTKVLELVAAGDELKSMKRELRGPYLSQWVLPSDPDESRDDRFAVLTDRDITELEAHAEALPSVRHRTMAVLKKLFCYRDELRDCSEMQKIFGELSR